MPATEYRYTEIEKRAAQITDQLCPVFVAETGTHIGPKAFKAITLRLAELLEDLLTKDPSCR